MTRWILIAGFGLGALVSLAAWAISLPGLHWGRPGVLSVYFLDGLLTADSIAFTSNGWTLLDRPIDLSRHYFWPPDGSLGKTYREVTTKWAWRVWIPLWMPTAGFLVPLLLLMLTRRRKHPPGSCADCGYSLRGNVTGACPECGRAIAPKS